MRKGSNFQKRINDYEVIDDGLDGGNDINKQRMFKTQGLNT